ncbi:hypothetical protein ADL00_23875 [Streptomyces sp. AS58]|nr:hypothetical protein ADL00_23875 [Streptomyces sp. AS58]
MAGQAFTVALGQHLVGVAECLACEDRSELVGSPGLCLAAAGGVEGARGGPEILRDVDEDKVEQDVHGDVAAFGFGVDEAELVVGAVDEDDPWPVVVRGAVVGCGVLGFDAGCFGQGLGPHHDALVPTRITSGKSRVQGTAALAG